MKKSEYSKYINPEDFAKLYEEWAAAGKPDGNHPLFIKIWSGVENAVKACIGSLQTRYCCKYQDYEEKVMDSTILIVKKLKNMEDYPKNIVTLSYLPTLGVCCNKKAIQYDFENNMMSTEEICRGGDEFNELIFMDEDGYLQIGNY